jgi:formylglycine-generating enzyme required for sulfatase activity
MHPEGVLRDPVRSEQGGSSRRVDRGGSFFVTAVYARSASRDSNVPERPDSSLGLRPARRIHP